jgi:hypothetical protein
MDNLKRFTTAYAQAFTDVYPQFAGTEHRSHIEKSLAVACANIRVLSIDGPAFELTARRLGIERTYEAFEEFLATSKHYTRRLK